MCLSAEASFIAAAGLIPAGALSIARAYRTDSRYIPIAALPLLFGLQQGLEGMVWMADGNAILVEKLSLAYMFCSWMAWPVWVPFSVYFLETEQRKPLYLVLAIVGGMIGAMQYFLYFAHDGWLTTQFLPRIIVYSGTQLFDNFIGRMTTHSIYVVVVVVVGSLLLSSDRTTEFLAHYCSGFYKASRRPLQPANFSRSPTLRRACQAGREARRPAPRRRTACHDTSS